MATVVTKTIGSGGGYDYGTLATWEAGEQRDLTAVDEIARALCANILDVQSCVINGWTTDATRYILIEAEDAHGSTGLVTTNAYRMVRAGPYVLQCVNNFVWLKGIQIEFNAAASGDCLIVGGPTGGAGAWVVVEDCVVLADRDEASRQVNLDGIQGISGVTSLQVVNSFVSGAWNGRGIRPQQGASGEVHVYSSIVRRGILASVGTSVIKNSVLTELANGSDAWSGGAVVSVSSGADDNSFGTYRNLKLFDEFMDFEGFDYRLRRGGTLFGNGTDTSAEAWPFNFTDDIRGKPRGTVWQIGAWELPERDTATVGSGGGYDYSSLAAAIAGEARDLVVGFEESHLLCHNFQDTSFAEVIGYTTDSECIVTVEAADYHGSYGAITTDAYRLVRSGAALKLSNTDVYVKNLQLQGSTNGINDGHSFANHDVEGCVVITTGTTSPMLISGLNAVVRMRNCIFRNTTGVNTPGATVSASGSYVYFYNCVSLGGINVTLTAQTLAKNCYASQPPSLILDAYVGVTALTTCASSDASGSPGLQNVPFDNTTFRDVATFDLRLSGDSSPLRAVGTDLSAEAAALQFDDDIRGWYHNGWDLGAFEDPTVVTKTVGPAHDYSSLSGWTVGEFQDLTVSNKIARALCANFADTASSPIISGWITDDDRYLLVEAEDIHGSTGDITTNAYRLQRAGDVITLRTNCAKFRGLQVESTTGAGYAFEVAISETTPGAGRWVEIEKCVVHSTGWCIYMILGSDPCVLRAWNTFLWGTVRCFTGANQADLYAYLYNCTCHGDFVNSGSGMGAAVAKNCHCDSYSGAWSLTTSSSVDATGSPGLQNIPYDNTTFVDTATLDLRPNPGGPLLNVGTDLSADLVIAFTDDIAGTIRPLEAAWDIGTFERASVTLCSADPLTVLLTLPDPTAVLGTLTPVADPLPVVVSLPDPIVAASALGAVCGVLPVTVTQGSASLVDSLVTVTADPLNVRAWIYNQIYAQIAPATTVPTHASRAEWGGIVIARPGANLSDDIQTLTDFGFRILGSVERAGESRVYVYADENTCRAWVSDIHENKRLRAHFVPYPVGERITMAGVERFWNDGIRLIV